MPSQESEKNTSRDRDLNLDPITGEPGAHPVGTGVGAAAGGATGAAVGALGGPIGVAVGAVIGAVAGGLAGKGVAESIDPTAEHAYWQENHEKQPYVEEEPFEDYGPAYRTGYTGYRPGKTFEEREAELRMEYEGAAQKDTAEKRPTVSEGETPGTMQNYMTTNPLRWDKAREAARVAYERVSRGEAAKRTAD